MNINDIQFTYMILYTQFSRLDYNDYRYSDHYRSLWIDFLDTLRAYYKNLSIVRYNKTYKCCDVVSHNGKLRLEFYSDVDGFIGINLTELSEYEK